MLKYRWSGYNVQNMSVRAHGRRRLAGMLAAEALGYHVGYVMATLGPVLSVSGPMQQAM
jgi:hypothetical protein